MTLLPLMLLQNLDQSSLLFPHQADDTGHCGLTVPGPPRSPNLSSRHSGQSPLGLGSFLEGHHPHHPHGLPPSHSLRLVACPAASWPQSLFDCHRAVPTPMFLLSLSQSQRFTLTLQPSFLSACPQPGLTYLSVFSMTPPNLAGESHLNLLTGFVIKSCPVTWQSRFLHPCLVPKWIQIQRLPPEAPQTHATSVALV